MIFPYPLTLAYSPCPNDAFIFAAWTHGLLPNAPPVKVVLDDVEALNDAARSGVHALTKVSYGAIPNRVGERSNSGWDLEAGLRAAGRLTHEALERLDASG